MDKKTIAKTVLMAAVALGAIAARAETYYLSRNANTISPFTSANIGSYWTNSVGVAPVYGQVSASEDVFWVDRGWGIGVYNETVFPGKTLHLGSADGSQTGTLHLRNVKFTANDVRWHAGRIYQNYGGVTTPVYGNFHLDCPSENHRIEPNAGATGIILDFACSFICDDTTMALTIISSSKMATDNLVIFRGDNSGYDGKISCQITPAPFVIGSANALGNPSAPRADALSVDLANAVVTALKGVTPNAVRGIAINKSGVRLRATVVATHNASGTSVRTTTDCSDYELPMPISGAYGFTKDGEGTVTLSGAYTAGAIVVEEGTLRIAATATLPAAHPVTVKSGATLRLCQAPENFALTVEAGANVVLEAAYDATAKVTTPVALTAGYAVPAGGQPIALSEAVALPQHDALNLEVLTIAAGAADVTADDFTDVSPKTYGLPKTTVTVEKDAGGVQHVYLSARPVVKSIKIFYTPEGSGYNYYKINGAPELWSDNRAAHEGADYLLVHQVNSLSNVEFDGDSLTISIPAGSTTTLHVRETVALLRATLYPPTIIRPNYGGRSFDVYGDWTIAGAFDDAAPFVTFYSRYKEGGYLSFRGALHGEGPLKLTAESVGSMSLKNGVNQTRLYGDNSDYTGRLYVTHEGSPTNEYVGTQFGFNSAAALGGAPGTFRANAITLDKYSMMCPSTNITFDTANRGISGTGPYGFNVPTGVTFAVKVPIYQNNTMYKTGAGTLALGGEMTFGTNNLCRVREGGLTALSDAAVAELDCTFADGTSIVLSPDSTAANGFRNVTIEDAAGRVNVQLAVPPEGIDGAVTLPICTVPATDGDLTGNFAFVRVKHYAAKLVKEDVTVDGVPCRRYSAHYVREGLTILFR
ncbi:MAG: autotransporter-associated beta strand repeat-containing protein [Kiritimatiellae bacterium]|nr:autotransporter-associated beta strand repeat-containing protein [Kiritimatiellia bacterium]